MRSSGSISSDFLTQYTELVSLLSPEDRVKAQRSAVQSVERYLGKKLEWIDEGSVQALVRYHLYRTYVGSLLVGVLGAYGIYGPKEIEYFLFSTAIYKAIRNRSPSTWLAEIEKTISMFLFKFGAENEEERKMKEEILTVLGVLSAKVFYYLDHTSEGREEVEILSQRVIEDLRRREKEVEQAHNPV